VQFFLDTADINEITKWAATGILDGVTTNPSLVAKQEDTRPFPEILSDICRLVQGPVSAEVLATVADDMVAEGVALSRVADNVVLKLPLTWAGIRACHTLSSQGIRTNMTLCFTVPQAIMAAKAGATFISPFIGRLDDAGQDGLALVRDIAAVYRDHDIKTQVLAASIRHIDHVTAAALVGAHAITCPPKVFDMMLDHPLTEKGLADFLKDAQSSK
jgi:transaldolase